MGLESRHLPEKEAPVQRPARELAAGARPEIPGIQSYAPHGNGAIAPDAWALYRGFAPARPAGQFYYILRRGLPGPFAAGSAGTRDQLLARYLYIDFLGKGG